MKKNIKLSVSAIQNGTAIDHIPAKNLFKVLMILGLDKLDKQITFGTNLESKKLGAKGIIKVSDKFFLDEEINKIALVAPQAKLNFIKDYKVVEKRIVERDGKIVQEEYSYTKDVPGVKRWEIIIPPILINNLIILIVILIIGILYSHKIAGPVHRIKTDIQKVISGKRDIRILLRKKDKLQELADSVNLLIEKFEQFKEESDK